MIDTMIIPVGDYDDFEIVGSLKQGFTVRLIDTKRGMSRGSVGPFYSYTKAWDYAGKLFNVGN